MKNKEIYYKSDFKFNLKLKFNCIIKSYFYLILNKLINKFYVSSIEIIFTLQKILRSQNFYLNPSMEIAIHNSLPFLREFKNFDLLIKKLEILTNTDQFPYILIYNQKIIMYFRITRYDRFELHSP